MFPLRFLTPFQFLTVFAVVVGSIYGQSIKSPRQVIQGKVFDVQGNNVSGAKVWIEDNKTGTESESTVTDRSGEFGFDDIPPGEYLLKGESADLEMGFTSVAIAQGHDARDLKIQLRQGGAISGRAVDEQGQPIAGAKAELLRRGFDRVIIPGMDWPTDPNLWAPKTNADGEFLFWGVPPGEYLIRVSAQSLPSRASYPTTYYPNVTNSDSAVSVMVAVGREADNLDVHLAPNGFRVRGRLIGKQRQHQKLFLIPRNMALPVAPPDAVARASGPDGRFEILGVAPGSYYLYYASEPATIPSRIATEDLPALANKVEWVRVPIEVGARDLDNLTLAITDPGRLRGEIAIDPQATEPEDLNFSNITIGLEFSEMVPTIRWEAYPQIDSTGRFELARVSEGNLRIREVNLPDGWFLSELFQDGADVTSSGLFMPAGKNSTVKVIISNFGGEVIGTIRDAENVPVPSSRYILLPESTLRDNPLFIRSGTSYEGGRFKLQGLAPGEYTLIAFPDEEKFSPTFVRNLENISQYEAFGQHIHVGAGQTTQVTVVVVPLNYR